MKKNKLFFDNQIKLVSLEKHKDIRGFFYESYSKKKLLKIGIKDHFVQDNHSFNIKKGIIRGLHIQKHPFTQSKLISVISGSIQDVVVDLRVNSKFFGKTISVIMRSKLKDRSIIINEALSFVKRCYKKIPLHIVSGSEQDELRCVCEFIEIGSYFLTIEGSPTSKNDLVSSILSSYRYDPEKTILIGDTINDYDAAKSNKVIFYAYNNGSMKDLCNRYIYSFDEVFFN